MIKYNFTFDNLINRLFFRNYDFLKNQIFQFIIKKSLFQ